MTPQSQDLIGYRYLVQEPLGQGGMGIVYRATDRLTGQQVALKRVHFPTEDGDTNARQDSQLSLANEFQTLSSLRHPYIISVLDYGFDHQQRPYFTMEFLDSALPVTHYARGKPLREKVRLFSEMMQALTYLHRRGISHRDLKPDNAVVQLDGHLRLLDFGLAGLQNQSLEDVAGTLAYMAPEIFYGQPANTLSDLYAAGVIGFEMFAEQHPFTAEDPTQLITDILIQAPDTSSLDIPSNLANLLDRMLRKAPETRPQSAAHILNELYSFKDIDIPQENVAVRESFLQAARFIGRDKELGQLEKALKQLLHHQQGSRWLIAGESGVGKTRLMDELRSRALIRGVLVLRGQSISEGSLPYHLWRDVIKRLVLSTDVGDLEAAILKEIVPDIPQLLQRPIPDAPEIQAKARQERLILTIADLFRRQNVPILLLLDDLQWIDESVQPLRYLTQMADQMPLMIVGSYRNDEPSSLPQFGPEVNVMNLQRLEEDAIRQLSYSMLGEVGRQIEVVDLLKRETEGNIFFLIEVVRTLAEEAGALNLIGQMTLPGRVFAEGVKSVVSRRLQNIPEEARPLLEKAAVAGRYLDLKLLQYLATGEGIALDQWLAICSNGTVIELHNERWQFAHDRLREVVLERIAPKLRPRLHEEVAHAIEAVYQSENNLPSQYATLAHHYGKAGHLAKEREYARRAGEYAASRFATADALYYLQRALDMTPLTDIQERFELLCIREALADNVADRALQMADLTTLEGLAKQLGDAARAEVALRYALLGMNTGEYSRGIRQARRAIRLSRKLNLTDKITEAQLRWGQCLSRQGRFALATDHLKEALHLAREMGSETHMAVILLSLGNAAIDMGSYAEAQDYYERSLETARRIGDYPSVSRALNNMGEVARYRYDFITAHFCFEQAYQSFYETGNRRGIGASLGNMGLAAIAQGHYLDALRYYDMADVNLRQTGDSYNEAWVRLGQGWVRALLGHTEEGLKLLNTSLEISRRTDQRDVESWTLTTLSSVYLEVKQYELARDYSHIAATIGRELQGPPMEVYGLIAEGHALLALGQVNAAYSAYEQAFAIQTSLRDLRPAIEAMAGLAEIDYARGRDVRDRVDQLLGYTQWGYYDGATHPLRVCHILYRILTALNDHRAQEVLREAHERYEFIRGSLKNTPYQDTFAAKSVLYEWVQDPKTAHSS